MEKCLGKEEKEVWNDKWTRIINLCTENDFIIGNTKFTHSDLQGLLVE